MRSLFGEAMRIFGASATRADEHKENVFKTRGRLACVDQVCLITCRLVPCLISGCIRFAIIAPKAEPESDPGG